MKVLQISANFIPNIGGVETHLSDLVNALVKRNWSVFTLTYRPLSTKIAWRMLEKNKKFTVLRIPWISGFFEKLVPFPAFEFIYLVLGLFSITPFVILFFKPNVIHAHGLISTVPALFWGKLFRRRIVVSLHNIYSFPKKGLYRNFVKKILNECDFVLSLSKKSYDEIRSLGVKKEKLRIFTYWINLDRFKKIPRAKEKLNLKRDSFIVLFVGRLIVEKGVRELLNSSNFWNKNIDLIIAGTGLLESEVKLFALNSKNIIFLGKVEQERLPLLYSAADIVIFPSVSEEGFGRVIIESLACSTPVLASNRGSITEVMDGTVGKFVDVSSQNLKKWVEYFYHNKKKLRDLADRARKFAESRYSERNVAKIIQSYTS